MKYIILHRAVRNNGDLFARSRWHVLEANVSRDGILRAAKRLSDYFDKLWKAGEHETARHAWMTYGFRQVAGPFCALLLNADEFFFVEDQEKKDGGKDRKGDK